MEQFTIYSWMMTEMQLKDMAIIVYAFFYQHFKDGTTYEGTLEDMATFLGITRQGLGKILRRMITDGLLIKSKAGVKTTYCVNPDKIK